MVPEELIAAGALAVLCGPTAVGKTEVAIPLAERLGAEIVCADSRTVYRRMDIGTAKPPVALRRRVPHHLIDIIEPDEPFTLADYQRLATRAIAEIRARGRLPLLVGGTGLYIRAIADQLVIPPVPPDQSLRARLEAEEREHGPGHLYARLAALDPLAARRIHPRNLRRVIRALEVTMLSGTPISQQQGRGSPSGPLAVVGLTMERGALYRRIDARVDAQLAAGLVDEVRGLLASGVPAHAPAMQGLGYREIAGWLAGAYELDEAVRRLKRNTRRYAKRQLTWFRRDPRIVWVPTTGADADSVAARVHAIMDAKFSG
ncbi:MAG: tRNA (adenosine(37)-N6)-dimethylallyltransferase MiaA [Armatimonadota bacterium]|nr:tRNA (adenosine(37)-N6)-dimethylallyltransferase MiaA [Armatimonadota bacterium]